jgi:serine protease Do
VTFHRSWVLAAAAAVAAASCGGPQRQPPRQRLTVKQIVEKSKPAIVRIEADTPPSLVRPGQEPQKRLGTGFAIDPSGIIVTNVHVVGFSENVQVKFLDGTSHRVKRVLGYDLMSDLTLLALDLSSPMPALKLGNSELVEAGDPVVAIGNPLGLDYTVSDGLVSSVRVVCRTGEDLADCAEPDQVTMLQISAPISQGSSGGPVFNAYGEVIGVSTGIFDGGQNLNIAMPAKYLQPMLERPRSLTLGEFASELEAIAAALRPERDGLKVERHVPEHEMSVLDGCTGTQLHEIAAGITEAIEVGAPLYNAGNHEACYRIYEGTSMKFETHAACNGVRTAFRDGLDRARTMTSYTEKAWALRDTFDGLLKVMERKARSGAP